MNQSLFPLGEASSALKAILKMRGTSEISQNLAVLFEIFPNDINTKEEFQEFLAEVEKIEKAIKGKRSGKDSLFISRMSIAL